MFLTLPTRALTGQHVISPQERRGGSFDHLVGAGQDRWRDGEAESLGGLQIHNQFESCGLLDREVGRFLTLQDLVDVVGREPNMSDRFGP